MNVYLENVEKDFMTLMQEEVQFVHKDKVLKEGRLVLFSVKDFYLTFQLYSKELKKIIHYELPYPFKYTHDSSKISLSYKQDHFTKKDIDIEHHILFYFDSKPSKLYNSEVQILKVK